MAKCLIDIFSIIAIQRALQEDAKSLNGIIEALKSINYSIDLNSPLDRDVLVSILERINPNSYKTIKKQLLGMTSIEPSNIEESSAKKSPEAVQAQAAPVLSTLAKLNELFKGNQVVLSRFLNFFSSKVIQLTLVDFENGNIVKTDSELSLNLLSFYNSLLAEGVSTDVTSATLTKWEQDEAPELLEFFNKVIKDNFDDLVMSYSGGLLNLNSYYKNNYDIAKEIPKYHLNSHNSYAFAWGNDNFSVLDETPRITKLLISNTPRLSFDEEGNIVKTNKILEVNEVTNVMSNLKEMLSGLSFEAQSLNRFNVALNTKNLIIALLTDPYTKIKDSDREVLLSMYNYYYKQYEDLDLDEIDSINFAEVQSLGMIAYNEYENANIVRSSPLYGSIPVFVDEMVSKHYSGMILNEENAWDRQELKNIIGGQLTNNLLSSSISVLKNNQLKIVELSNSLKRVKFNTNFENMIDIYSKINAVYPMFQLANNGYAVARTFTKSEFDALLNIINTTAKAASTNRITLENLENFKSNVIGSISKISLVINDVNGLEFKATIKTLSGTTMPTISLINTISDDKTNFLEIIPTIEYYGEKAAERVPVSHNIFCQLDYGNLQNTTLVEPGEIRTTVYDPINDVTKDPDKMNASELYSYAFMGDFLGNLDSGVVYFQPVTFSDKKMQHTKKFNISGGVYFDGRVHSLTNFRTQDFREVLSGLHRDSVGKQYQTAYNIAVSDLNKIFRDRAIQLDISALFAYQCSQENIDIEEAFILNAEGKYELSSPEYDGKLERQKLKELNRLENLLDILAHSDTLLKEPDLDFLIRIAGADVIIEAGNRSGIPVMHNLHFSGKGKKTKFNAVLATENSTYSSDEAYNLRMSRAKAKLMNDFLNDMAIFNISDNENFIIPAIDRQIEFFIENIDPSFDKYKWANPSGELVIALDQDGKKLHYADWNQADFYAKLKDPKHDFSEYTLNPLIEYYFWLHNVLAMNYNLATMGGTFGHDIKINTDKASADEIIAASTTAADKRMVAEQATFHVNNTGALDALPFEFNTAVIGDRFSDVFNKIGQSEGFAVGDGSALWCGFGMSLANRGMVSAQENGLAKKFIHHQFNPHSSIAVLEKYAAFSINNEACRASRSAQVGDKTTGVNMKNLLKKMSDLEIPGLTIFSEEYNKSILIPTENDNEYTINSASPILYLKNGNLITLETIKNLGNDLTEVKVSSINILGEQTTEIFTIPTPKSVYQVWELYGAENSLSINPNGKFIFGGTRYSYSDSSIEHAVDFMVNFMKPKEGITENLKKTLSSKYYDQPFKDKIIYQLNNTSGIKNGAQNMNPVSSWFDNAELMSFKVNVAHFGVQGMFSHEFSEEHASEVTEMSLVISAAEAMGNKTAEVRRLYNNLNNVVSATMLKYTKYLNSPTELSAMMTQEMIKLLADKDDISFANTYLKRIKAKAKQLGLTKDLDKLQTIITAGNAPFSDNNIFNAMISMMRGSINRTAIKRKYPGIAAILVPGHDSYFVRDTETGTKLDDGEGQETLVPITDWANVNEYDTYLVTKEGTSKYITFANPDDYYEYLNSLSSEPLYDSISLVKGRARNLMTTRVEFTTEDGTTFTRNDFDTTKTFYGIQKLLKLLEYKFELQNNLLLDDVSKVRRKLFEESLASTIGEIEAFKATNQYKAMLNTIPNLEELFPDDEKKYKAARKNDKELYKSLRYKHLEELNNADNGTLTHTNLSGDLVTYNITHNVSPAELLLSNINMHKFGIEEGMQLSDITLDYFKTKLKEQGKSPKTAHDLYAYTLKGLTLPILSELNAKDYPRILYIYDEVYDENGESMGIYYLDTDGNPLVKYSENIYFVEVDGVATLVYKDVNSLAEVLEDPTFKFSGIDYNYKSNQIFSILETLDPKLYSQIVIESTEDNDLPLSINNKALKRIQADVERRINIKASQMYGSWIKSLEIIGARIPAQSLLSFMAMKVVGFLNGTSNTAIVPITKNWLDGSDFDIDKIYLMTYSINKNGILAVQGGKYFNWEFINESLRLPFQKETNDLEFTTQIVEFSEDDNLSQLAEALLNWVEEKPSEDFETRRAEWAKVVEALNYINDTNTIPIFKGTDEDEKNIVDKVNSYFSQKFHNDDARLEASKNAVVFSLLNISSSVVNMMNNERPVDMDAPRGAAKKSVMGESAKYLERENPASILKMIVEQLAGKTVTGIAAVAEKIFFNYSHFVNQELIYADNLLSGLDDIASKEMAFSVFDKLSPKVRYDLNGKKYIPTLIANASFKDKPRLSELYSEWLKLKAKNENATVLDCRVQEDGSLVISAVLSAATDNAKELILDKINAGPELAGTYLTMVMQGIPFEDIANFMTSPVINAVVKAAKSNIFNQTSYSIESAIKQFKEGVNPLEYLEYGEMIAAAKLIRVPGRPKNLKEFLEIFNSKDIITKLKAVGLVTVITKYGNEEMGIPAQSHEINISKKLSKFMDRVKLLNSLISLTGLSEKDFFEYLNNFEYYKEVAEETELAGRRLGINQGMKGTLYDLHKFDYNLNNFIYKQLLPYKLDIEYPKGVYSLKSFCDIRRAHADPFFGAALAKAYEKVKYNFNIVEVELKLPHISAMLDASYDTLKFFEVSAKYRAFQKAIKLLSGKQLKETNEGFTHNFSEKEIKRITTYLDNIFISSFFDSNEIEVLVKQYYTNYVEGDEELVSEVLNNANSKANFKKTFEIDVLLEMRERHPDNKFLNNLLLTDKQNMITGSSYSKTRMAFNTSTLTDLKENYGNNTSTAALEYDAIKNDLMAIKDEVIFGKSFIQLLELYNILINNNNYGDETFTRILNDIMSIDTNFKDNSLSLQYMEYVSKLEQADLLASEESQDRLMLNLAVKKDNFFKAPKADEKVLVKYMKDYSFANKSNKIFIWSEATREYIPYNMQNEEYSDNILDQFLTTSELTAHANEINQSYRLFESLQKAFIEGKLQIITNC